MWKRCVVSCLLLTGVAGPARATTRYVWTNSPNANGVSPYTNWAQAAHSIQTVHDAAVTVAGDEILATDGVYNVGSKVVGAGNTSNRVAITKAVTVRSVNGPSVTFILGGGLFGSNNAIRCAYVTNGATLAGFTLTGGVTRSTGLDYYGGGVYCQTNGVVSNCVIAGNAVPISGSGGGIFQGRAYNCVISNNVAGYGGGVAFTSLNDCQVLNNSATNDGGGVYLTSAQTLSNCFISGNSAPSGSGGGVFGGTLLRCTLTGNSGSGGGGANGSALTNCILSGNSAVYGGGANGGTLDNCFVSRNTASNSGGGVYQVTMIGCTVVGNSAAVSGGGAFFSSYIDNSILYYNSAPDSPNYHFYTPNHSCTTPDAAFPQSGNISTPPLVAGIDNPHLLAGSPCINAGYNDVATGLDIDSETRVSSAVVDMGCDEYAAPLSGAMTVQIRTVWTNVAVGFAALFEAVVSGKPSQYVWTWGDGTATTKLCVVSHAFATTGVYSVVLLATNASGSASATASVQVVTQPVHYVAPGGGNVSPYTNWVTAATNLQDAIAAGSIPGRLVLVSNGLYQTGGTVVRASITNRVALTNAVVVQSVNGPSVTSIRGSGPLGLAAVRCAFVGSNCVLAGFTMTNGFTRNTGLANDDQSGGGVWCEDGAIVTNCVVTANSAYNYGGGSFGGTLRNCTLSLNTANNGAGAYAGSLDQCTLSRNTAASSGGGSYNSLMTSCMVVSNKAGSGGGAFGSIAYNCVFSRNAATSYGGGTYQGVQVNCLVTANAVTNYGGGTAQGRQVNCTICGNWASVLGGGSYNGTISYNSIVYYNGASNSPNHHLSSVWYGCTTADATNSGFGIVTNPPAFVDTNNWSDLHLATNSPCINAATNAFIASPTDFDGLPRIIGGRADLGAYESTNGVTTNGVAWGWLVQHGFATDGTADLLDTDGDSYNNRAEYIADTQPTNPASLLVVTQIANATNKFIWFNSSPARVYTLQASTNLPGGTWTNVPGNIRIPGPGGAASLQDTNGAPGVAYRIGVELP